MEKNEKLDFAVIGGQKCGSTYLQSVINNHPDIQMVKGEVPFFENPDYSNDGMLKLNKLLAELDKSKTIGIKRPNLLAQPYAPDRIINFNSEIKAIAILRNPLERLKSAYFHYINDGFAPVKGLNSGISNLLDGKLANTYKRTEELLEFGLYADHIINYKTVLKDNLLVLFYDDLKNDKLEVIKRCYSFLSVDNTYIPEEKYLTSRPQKVNYSLARSWLLTKKNNYQYDYNDEKTRLFYKEQSDRDKLVCRRIDQIDKLIVSRLFKSNKKPEYSEVLKKRLINFYQKDIEKLEVALGVDLSHWLDK